MSDKDNAQMKNILGQMIQNFTETSDPVNEKGELVDQNVNPLPRPQEFIVALNEAQAQRERDAMLENMAPVVSSLRMEFGNYVDMAILRNPKSVFEGPTCPYHFTWVEDYAAGRDIPRLSESAEREKQMFLYLDYSPANFHDIGHLLATGRDAALLAIKREAHIMRAMGAKNQSLKKKGAPLIPPPPQLPPSLWEKFGIVMPPVISGDGHYWVGRFRLYRVSRTRWLEQQAEAHQLANSGMMAPNPNGFADEGSQFGRATVDLDAMFGRR